MMARMIGLNEAFASESPPEFAPEEVRALVQDIFRQGGLLESRGGLQHRPQQSVMAGRALRAWQSDSALLFEAGTGVGKSLAYLLPGILQSVSQNRPLVISTHTIALQEQIQKKDLPLCRRLLAADPRLKAFSAFKDALLLGRGNYLCGTRLAQALRTRTELFPNEQQKELERIAEWARTTETGLIQELAPMPHPEVWDWVQADGHACNSRNCNPRTCFFRKAREAVRQSNLIIVNHSLLFALLAAGHFPSGDVPGILFPLDFVVLDEAHTLPHVATEYFGRHLSAFGLRRQLQRLYHPQRRRPSGLLIKHGESRLRTQVAMLADEAAEFFKNLHAEFLSRGRPLRLLQPAWTANSLDEPLRDLIHGIQRLESRLEEGPERDEIEGARRVLQSYREGLQEVIELADPESVYWMEPAGTKGDLLHLRSAPLDIAGPLRKRLFERRTGILLTSATLAEGKAMDSFQQKVGADEAICHQEASPFDYTLQMEILIHRNVPQPSANDNRLDVAFLAGQIARLATEVDGGTLALFTSYKDLMAVQRRLQPAMTKAGRLLLHQGSGTSRTDLLLEFKGNGRAVLLGTDSFWTGIDVPGSALSQLIITRLPFENPSHPVAEARASACAARGGQPFHEITLPAALIKFRQGMGRLIRNQTDEGRLVILDSRILNRPYGRLFLEVLPHGNLKFLD